MACVPKELDLALTKVQGLSRNASASEPSSHRSPPHSLASQMGINGGSKLASVEGV